MADNNTKIIISAEDKASAALSSISKNVGGLQAALGGLGATLGATLTVGGFAAFVKSTIDAADQMNDLSQKVGIAVKDLGTWKLAAESSGASMESIAKGVKGLSAYMHDHSKELKAAGITATDAGGAMTQLADIFKAMPDGVEKTNLAVKLFGKAGMDLIPMLNMGSQGLEEMREKSAEYSRQLAILAPQADKFNDELAVLSLNSKAAGMNIANHLIGPMTLLVKAFGDLAAGGERAWAVMQKLADAGHPIARSISAWRGILSPEAGRTDNGWALAGLDPKTGQPVGAGGMMLPGANSPAELAAMRRAAILNPVAAAAAGKAEKIKIFGPDVKLFDDDEAAKYTKAQKEAADAVDAATKSLADHANALGKDIAAAEKALETYGLTESQIADLTLARLKHAKAMEAEQDADEATLAWYDREIEALERIRTAKFQIEARDTAKKEAEEAAKAWQNFARDLESSLTDALMRSFEAGDSFGEAFKDNLENLFKTMILKAAVQLTVGTVAGAAQQALGMDGSGAGGSGGIGSLLSSGSSIYNAATGGGIFGSIGGFGAGAASAASELALGASFVGPSASLAGGAVGAGATAGLSAGASGASALSGLAAAAPWIAGGLAIASIFGGDLFGSKKPAPIEWGLVDLPRGPNPQQYYGSQASLAPWAQYMEHGPFGTLLTTGQHLSRNGMSAGALQSQVTSPLIQLDKVLGGYLSEKEKNKISMALYNGREGEHGWNQGEVEGVMMRRLDRISDAIGGWVDKLADSTTGTLQERYTQLAQILSIRGDEFFEKLARDMFKAYGNSFDFKKFTALSEGVTKFKDLFYTDAEKFDESSAAVKKALGDLNLAVPESRDAFRDLVEGIDTGTKSGFKLYESLIALAPAMDGYYDALQAELDVKRQLSAMNESHFATAVDYTRYQRIAGNFDADFAGDYAYNIQRGAIQPGGAANGDLVTEIRALRTENQAQAVALAAAQQETARILRRWNGDGMPETRVVA